MQEAKTINVSAELLKQPSECWNLVVQWVSMLALHFRAEISEPEIRIYCESLGSEDRDRLSKAMQRCLNECEFMPKLKEIWERMPEERKAVKDNFVPVSDHFEPSECAGYHWHVWVNAEGHLRFKLERKVM